MLRVLLVHNSYQQPGGEDSVVDAEARLLTERGHHVVRYRRTNDELRGKNGLSSLAAGLSTVWSKSGYRGTRVAVEEAKPDVVHFHNTFPLISPAAYYACAEAGVPVVQTLHNYRLLCPAANLFRRGRLCEECCRHSLWRSVVHGCYRDSRAATSASALMLAVNRCLGTWKRLVDCYIALTEFSRKKFVEAGLPAEKIAVKPNFVHPDPCTHKGTGEYALFVGRLSEEKGVRTLLTAWNRLNNRIPLRIVGDGPLRVELGTVTSRQCLSSISLLGRLKPDHVTPVMKRARFLVFTSECYENFPLTIAEAFACGVPVICSRLGGMQEIVADGHTGLHFTPGDADDLAAKVEWAWTHRKEMAAMGRAARTEYEAKYTAERNYTALIETYQHALSPNG